MWKLALKFVAGFGVLALLIWAWDYYWHRPEIWNGTAENYKTNVAQLKSERAKLRADSAGLARVIEQKDSVIGVRDGLIRTIKKEFDDAIAYGQQWQEKFNSAISQRDGAVDQLSEKDRELALYKAYEKNGTLAPVKDIKTLSPASPKVVTASLKTAYRAEESARANDSLARAYGAMKAARLRLGAALVKTRYQLDSVDRSIDEKLKGGVPILRSKRRKQLKQVKAQNKGIKIQIDIQIDQESDLEKVLLNN